MGEILDEYDDNPDIEKIDDENYIVSGLMSLSDLNDYLDIELNQKMQIQLQFSYWKVRWNSTDTKNCEVRFANVKLKLLKLDDKRIDKIHLILNSETE